MPVINVKLPDGTMQSMSYPEGWNESQIKEAINKHFPMDKFTSRESEENIKEPSLMQNILHYAVKEPLIGAAKFGEDILNAPHNIAALFSDALAKKIPSKERFDYRQALGLPEDKNLSESAIEFLPELLGAFAVPEANLGKLGALISKTPKAGKYLTAGLEAALPQSLYNAALSDEEQAKNALEAAGIVAPFSMLSKAVASGSPAIRKLAKGSLLGGGAALGYELGEGATGDKRAADVGALLGAVLASKGLSPKKSLERSLLEGVDLEEVQPALDAAKRLGLDYLTPAEATGNPFLGAGEGILGRSGESAKLRYEKGEKRLASEEQSIQNLLKSIFDKDSMDSKVTDLYSQAYQKSIPESSLSGLKDNEIFKRAERIVANKPAFKESLKNVDKNSIVYLDHVKMALDDMIEKAPNKEARLIKKTKDDLLNLTDELAPEYKKARNFAERDITRKTIEDFFAKKPMSGQTLYKAIENKNKFNDLMHHLRNVPEAQQQLQDMRLVFKNLISPPTTRTASALSRTSMTQDRSSLQTLSDMLKNALSGGKYDEHAIELITNPNWSEKLADLSKVSNKEMLASRLISLLGKAGANIGVDKYQDKDINED